MVYFVKSYIFNKQHLHNKFKIKYIQYNLRESISQFGEIELNKDEFIINIYSIRNSIEKIIV